MLRGELAEGLEGEQNGERMELRTRPAKCFQLVDVGQLASRHRSGERGDGSGGACRFERATGELAEAFLRRRWYSGGAREVAGGGEDGDRSARRPGRSEVVERTHLAGNFRVRSAERGGDARRDVACRRVPLEREKRPPGDGEGGKLSRKRAQRVEPADGAALSTQWGQCLGVEPARGVESDARLRPLRELRRDAGERAVGHRQQQHVAIDALEMGGSHRPCTGDLRPPRKAPSAGARHRPQGGAAREAPARDAGSHAARAHQCDGEAGERTAAAHLETLNDLETLDPRPDGILVAGTRRGGVPTRQPSPSLRRETSMSTRPPSRPSGAAVPRALSGRDRDILRDVIYTFISAGEPVSSRAVAKQERHGLSSASIRNIMADLEEKGYLRQPHTSAGRVPTPAGYHFYIETLMRQRLVPVKDRRYIDSHLDAATGGEERMTATTQLLSELTHQVGVVLIPALGDTVLKTVEFVPVSGRRVLCVVVSSTGFIDSKLVELEESVGREELVRAGNYLTDTFGGLALRDIRDRLLVAMDDERAQVDRLLTLSIALARKSLSEGAPELLMDGTAELLSQPELSDLGRVRRLFEAFQDKAKLVRLLNQCLAGGGVRAWIGDDSELTSELDFSLVAAPYGAGDRVVGSLGILGPSRMEYDKVIPVVEYLADTLSEALARTFEG
jgi:heat-inducible transcriptional repressor